MSGNAQPLLCKVAFVGAGGMAAEHIKAFRDVPGAVLSGIHSRTPARAQKLARESDIPVVCLSVGELYEATRADLVVVAVPALSVGAVSRECFKFPWTCLIEKPAGYNLADAAAIADDARSAGARAFVALNRRHYSSTRLALDDLATDSGNRFIHVQDQEDINAARRAGHSEILLKNWMFANSIHLIDYFTLFGRGAVRAVEPCMRWNPAEPAPVAATIRFASGDVGLYQAVWNAPGPWAVAVTTQARRWEMRPLEQAALQRAGQRRVEPAATDEWDSRFKPGLRRQAELAVRAASGLPVPELPTLDDALKPMSLAAAIYAEK